MRREGDLNFDTILLGIQSQWLEDFDIFRSESSYFKTRTSQVLKLVMEIGERSLKGLDIENDLIGSAPAYFFHYRFTERLKDFFLFWRDLSFQHLKAKLLVSEGKLTQEHLEKHWIQSKESLTNASNDLSKFLEKEVSSLDRPTSQRAIRRWSRQNNPWPIYAKQLHEIEKQISDVLENAEQATSHAGKFQSIGNLVNETLSLCLEFVNALDDQSGTLLDESENSESKLSPTLVKRLQQEEESLIDKDFLHNFSQQLEFLTADLPKKWEAIVGVKGGQLIKRDVELKSRTLQWLEGEIMPTLLDVFELTSKAQNTLRLAYSNMRNRALLYPSGVLDRTEFVGFFQPLHQCRDRLSRLKDKITERSTEINARLLSDFNLSKLYSLEEQFLPIPMQSTIRQFGQGGNRFFNRISTFSIATKQAVRGIISRVEKEESLGVPEKISRYIESRKPLPENEQYNPIFLARGFLGSSFASGRVDEMNQFHNILQQWKLGYRGAILLTGRRFCGKTFFGEWMGNLFFSADQVIKLEIGQDLHYQGRKLSATKDLDEVLDFIKKYALHDRPMIWIDDLELWHDANHTVYENAVALQGFIDHFANRCFVLASINRWAHENLKVLLNIDATFQSIIPLDHMPREDISRAILIRHGATHKRLIDHDGTKLSPGEFKTLIRNIDAAAHGNIGEALRWWLSSIRPVDENTIAPHFSDPFSMPRYFDNESSLILTRILVQKQTDEYQLRKYLGQAFNDRYSNLVRRLINMGLLYRLNDRNLEVHESLVNALAGRLLDRN